MTTEEIEYPTQYQVAILSALQSKPIYYGTVDDETIVRRRAKNKRARAARRVQRKRG